MNGEFPKPGTAEWGVMNRERAALIQKSVAGILTSEESERLEYLQRMSLATIDTVFPRGCDERLPSVPRD